MIREALTNVAEHASSTKVAGRLSAKKDHHPRLKFFRRSGAEVGGRLPVESRYGRGARVIATLPIRGVAS